MMTPGIDYFSFFDDFGPPDLKFYNRRNLAGVCTISEIDCEFPKEYGVSDHYHHFIHLLL